MSGPGIVKKLLFPAYADAGANATFAAKEGLESSDETALASMSTDDMLSEATTAIHDNRTFTRNDTGKDPHGVTRMSSLDSLRHQTGVETNYPTEPRTTTAQVSHPTASSFFPSTAPSVVRPLATTARTVSTTTRTGGVSIEQPFPVTSPRRPAPQSHARSSAIQPGNSLEQNTLTNEALNSLNDDTSANEYVQGKYQRQDNSDDTASDAMSTASEMGTVINISARMAEVNAMALMTPVAIAEEDSETETDAEGEEANSEIAANLSIPMLDEPPEALVTNNKDNRSHSLSTSASGMVSAAFRRIGAGVGTHVKSGAVSAPSTPLGKPRVEDYLKQYRTSEQTAPVSLLLRSPGSAAYQNAATRQQKPMLSPRFTQQPTARENSSESFRRQASSLASPLRFARGCFSFDNTFNDEGEPLRGQPLIQSKLQPRSTQVQNLIESKSWDSGNAPLSFRSSANHHDTDYTSAFRAIPGDTRILHGNPHHYLTVDSAKPIQDFSPSLSNNPNAISLRTPQRVEIEREDALDILACLVERSVAFEIDNAESDEGTETNVKLTPSPDGDAEARTVSTGEEDDQVSTFAEVGTRPETILRSPPQKPRKTTVRVDLVSSGALSSELIATVDALRSMSKVHDNERDHQKRMKALNELLRSHVYAGEMKRAAQSASTWLRSIGRAGDDDVHLTKRDQGYLGRDEPGSVLDRKHSLRFSGDREVEADSFVATMDALSLRARLHSLELQLTEKAGEAERLNAELSVCRAEIGRLKSASQADASFRSANRSILDHDDDDDSEVSDVGANVMGENDVDSPRPTVEGETIGIANSRNQFGASVDVSKTETNLLKAALVEANNTIRKLYAKGHGEQANGKPPVVPIPLNGDQTNVSSNGADNFITSWQQINNLPPPPDHDLHSPIVSTLLKQWTMDVNMHRSLLAWMDRVLEGSDPNTIPPLTISSLDPLVRDAFQMHILPLLLKRCDILVDVMTRAQRRTTFDIAITIRPNFDERLSNTPRATNAQVFAYKASNGSSLVDHSLSEDENLQPMAVTVSKDGGIEQVDSETESVTQSSVTAHISNSISSRRRPLEANVLSSSLGGPKASPQLEARGLSESMSWASPQRSGQPGLMSAINNRFGGLLSRGRKLPQSLEDGGNEGFEDQGSMQNHGIPPTFSSEEGENDEPQPYQRVLSCPPGRIGVTFVQYRGHAMVSDVSPESPLSGWVFPSDILIAIDEVPVSGMRVRDIVKLLTARKERQRALRVISSHAMNEFTLNTSGISENGM